MKQYDDVCFGFCKPIVAHLQSILSSYTTIYSNHNSHHSIKHSDNNIINLNSLTYFFDNNLNPTPTQKPKTNTR